MYRKLGDAAAGNKSSECLALLAFSSLTVIPTENDNSFRASSVGTVAVRNNIAVSQNFSVSVYQGVLTLDEISAPMQGTASSAIQVTLIAYESINNGYDYS